MHYISCRVSPVMRKMVKTVFIIFDFYFTHSAGSTQIPLLHNPTNYTSFIYNPSSGTKLYVTNVGFKNR